MRLQFPHRVSLLHALVYALAMLCVQQLQHTGRNFSLLFFAFVMLSAIAFNLARGFTTVIGSYVFWFSLLTTILGVTWKAVLNEPADSNLASPLLGMAAYTVSMALLIVVVLVNRTLDLRSLSIAARLGTRSMDFELAAGGCLLAGIAIPFLGGILPGGSGSILSILIQINVFPVVAILLGTIAVIRGSGGRRSVSLVSALSMLQVLFFGIVTYSKQGMLTPFVCWLAAAFYTRLRLRLVHWLAMAAFAAFAFTIVPYWANGRLDVPQEGASLPQLIRLAVFEAQNFSELKQQALETSAPENGVHSYYNTSQGLLDRLTILPADDPLFTYSETHPYFGYWTVSAYYINWIPHIFYPNKPPPASGNTYAHEIGGLAPDDFTTGISFSPVAEAYHIDGWRGIFFLLPLVWIGLFQSIDLVAGDMRYSPWGLLLVVYFAHAAAESLLGGLIYYTFNGNLGMAVSIFFCMRIAPILGSILPGRSVATQSSLAPTAIPAGRSD